MARFEKGAIEPGADCSKPQKDQVLRHVHNKNCSDDDDELKHHSDADEQSSGDEKPYSSSAGGQQLQVTAAARKLKLPCRRNPTTLPSGNYSHFTLPRQLADGRNCPTISLPGHASDLATGGPNPTQLQKLLAKPTNTQTVTRINPVHGERVIVAEMKKINTMVRGGISFNPRRVCRFCDREFPSGRALGGHMRVHGALAADSLPTDVQEPEQRQLDEFIARSSSLIANSRKGRLAELNSMISGSELANSSRRGVIRRRINSEESMVRGVDEEKPAVMRGVDEEQFGMREVVVAEEEKSVRRREQLVKREIFTEERLVTTERKLESSRTHVKEKSLELNFCKDQGFSSEDGEDEEESFGLHSSELMVFGNGGELSPAENNGNKISSVDKGTPLYKLRQNPKPSQRLWTDQEDFSIHQAALLSNQAIANHQSSASHHSFATRRSSSSPLLSERACCPCSECGKIFWSWKALFGHMRCHPEREWRGIQRPEVGSSEVEKQVTAGKKLNSFAEHSIAGNAELEMAELESDAENREKIKQTEAALRISSSAKDCKFTMKEEREAKESERSREEEGKESIKVEECTTVISKMGTKRSGETALLRDFTGDLTPSAWPTRKRSRRSRVEVTGLHSISEPALTSETATSSELRDERKPVIKDQEDLDMANCLVFLSSAGNKMQDMEKHLMETTQESAFRKHDGSPATMEYSEEADGEAATTPHNNGNDDDANEGDADDDAADADADAENHAVLAPRANGSGVKYECSTCKRCFNSHQALGGHRASHRKTKGCFARTNYLAEEVHDSGEDNIAEDEFVGLELNKWQLMRHAVVAPPLHHQEEEEKAGPVMTLPSTTERSPANNKKIKGHECSICHRIFPSGQALGGHKRCHWTGEKIAETASVASSSNNKSSLQEQAEWEGGRHGAGQAKKAKEDGIDLNLPAPLDEEDEIGYNNAGFSATEVAAPGVCGRLVDAAEGEQMVGSLVEYPGSRSSSLNGNGLSRDWIAKDLLGVDDHSGHGSWPQANRELEARCRFDGRAASGLWSQQWTSAAAAAAQIPQVCAMQPL